MYNSKVRQQQRFREKWRYLKNNCHPSHHVTYEQIRVETQRIALTMLGSTITKTIQQFVCDPVCNGSYT